MDKELSEDIGFAIENLGKASRYVTREMHACAYGELKAAKKWVDWALQRAEKNYKESEQYSRPWHRKV